MLTLHPQSAMEHLHHRFVAADGVGSRRRDRLRGDRGRADDARPRTLVPVRPAEPLAGAPDRSPIPLADNVQAAGAAMSAAAGTRPGRGRRRVRAGHRAGPGLHAPAQARLPPGDAAGLAARDPAPGGASRSSRCSWWSAAWRVRLGVRRPATSREAISSVNAGQDALDAGEGQPRPGVRPRGSTWSRTIRDEALELLTDAYDRARRRPRTPRSARGSSTRSASQVVAGLDRLYGVVEVASTPLSTSSPAEGASRVRPAGRSSVGPTARRTSSMRRTRPSTGSTSSASARRPSPRNGREVGSATHGRAALPGASAGATC